jgi:Uma2 family endonuclease
VPRGLRDGNDHAVINILRKIIDLEPNIPLPYVHLAEALIDVGDVDSLADQIGLRRLQCAARQHQVEPLGEGDLEEAPGCEPERRRRRAPQPPRVRARRSANRTATLRLYPLPGHAHLMGQPAEKRRRATYADLEAVPPGKVAELIDGQLYVFPRPAPRHLNASSMLGYELIGPFQRGRGGPGGWRIIDEPEVHFPEPAEPDGVQVTDPDLAGWRVERMPELPKTAYFPLAPDWICEVLSPSTEDHDRWTKMPLYAANGVPWAWLIDPIKCTLEVYVLGESRRWNEPTIYHGNTGVRAVPFDAIELDLSVLWTK